MLGSKSLHYAFGVDLGGQLSTARLVVESEDLRLHVTLLLLSRVNFLLGHLELVLSYLQLVGGLEQVRNAPVACEASQVHVGESVEVRDQLTHQIGVSLSSSASVGRGGETLLAAVLSDGTGHELIDLVVCFLNLLSQYLFHFNGIFLLSFFQNLWLCLKVVLLRRWSFESLHVGVLQRLCGSALLRNVRFDSK